MKTHRDLTLIDTPKVGIVLVKQASGETPLNNR